jgi:ubiquinone/menaquinone biosynthesis C-methylase UbiE
MDRITGAAEAFDLHADEYDRWFESPGGKALFEAEVEAVRALMGGLKQPFLEVGVGSGRFAEALGIGHGIDPSEAMVEMARKRGVDATKGAGEALPFEDGSFGGVFMLFTLCFVDDPATVLAEAGRVLRPDGGLVVGIINRESPWGLLYARKKSEGHPLYAHARFHSPGEVVGMLGGCGMAVEAFSSTLLGAPAGNPRGGPVFKGLREGAGFICILSRKAH